MFNDAVMTYNTPDMYSIWNCRFVYSVVSSNRVGNKNVANSAITIDIFAWLFFFWRRNCCSVGIKANASCNSCSLLLASTRKHSKQKCNFQNKSTTYIMFHFDFMIIVRACQRLWTGQMWPYFDKSCFRYWSPAKLECKWGSLKYVHFFGRQHNSILNVI